MNVKQFIDLNQKQAELQAQWDRQVLALAAGALALLAGLGPPAPTGIAKYFLAGTWVFLGIGIIAGAGATYLHVHVAKKLANLFQEQLVRSIQEDKALSPHVPIVAKPHKIFSWSKPVMITSLLLAVVCLVTYAVLVTLGSGQTIA